ncbi:DUF2076 domain-containing protein [Lichenifustis flavocetrariae]|uniref:DUF2076 domain-containing protein n=1 Tax=Lichenifustis flavocetrariae TaxID=2949735 RepID=A0AA41YRC4_9HYPH|nr:DUF2076 domain-containing protein [Lichenifustis flavocetrariae]MCW6506744.1 DUF2076 domain-containing protein [Lichenifustis flavocetrariae]
MTPDERQLLSGLFDRIRTAGTGQRDRDAESFITDAVKQQPYAPYLLAQTVIVQEQALRAANDKLQELEAKVQSLESGQQQGSSGSEGGFLGGLGRSIFGSGAPQQPPQSRQYAPPQPNYAPPQGQWNQNAGQQQAGPWGQGQQGGAGGGGFLKGALGMAAGVAGGALLANSISGLFHGSNNPFGISSGMGGFGGSFPGAGGETIVNNYYGDEAPPDAAGSDQGFDTAADYGTDDGGSFGGDDGDYNA